MASLTKGKVSHDILKIDSDNSVISKINSEKQRYEPISEDEQNEVIARKNNIVTDEVCIKPKLAYPNMKEMKVDTVQEFTIDLNNNEYELLIDLNKLDAFQSLKCKWLYYRLNRVEIEYENTTPLGERGQFTYQYLPPSYYMVKYGPYQSRDSVKTAKGGKYTLNNPLYIVRNAFHKRIDINSEYYYDVVKKSTVPSSGLQDNLFISNFSYDITYIDYGSFIFSSSSKQTIQAKIHYYFSFFTFGDPETQYGIEEHEPFTPFDPDNPL